MPQTIAPNPQGECVLVSAGCTTGWNDWIHGELWLCPDGLLRRRIGLVATTRHGMWRTVDPEAPSHRSFSTAELAKILSANRRNYWLPWAAIEQATLSQWATATQLLLRLTGGGHAKLLWVPADPSELIVEALMENLGSRFTQR